MQKKQYYPIFVILVLFALALAGCVGSPANPNPNDGSTPSAPLIPEGQPTMPLDPDDGAPAPDQPDASEVEYTQDLFNTGLCFVVNSKPVTTPFGQMNRVLEYLYTSEVKGDTLVYEVPASRGSDERTWGPWAVLTTLDANREVKCGEVEAHHRILYRFTPKEDLYLRFRVSLDTYHDLFGQAYESAATGGQLGVFLGSEKGVDLMVEVYDAGGNLITQEAYTIAGAYCSNCVAPTALTSDAASYAKNPEKFAFKESTRKVLTTDVYARQIPKDFKGYVEMYVFIEGGKEAEIWFGQLDPNAQ